MSTNTKKSKSSEETLEKLCAFINEKGGIVKKEEFAALDVDYRKILEFVETGTLVRIKNGYYTDRIDRFSEEELIARLFPDARLCMESALYAYGYIREKPYGWHLAVDKNTSKSRFKMDYPKVIPYYTEPEALELGSTTIEQNGLMFQIYDKERMICDCLKYEAKLDRAIFREAVQSYIRDNDKDISMLMEYARARKVTGKVQSLIGFQRPCHCAQKRRLCGADDRHGRGRICFCRPCRQRQQSFHHEYPTGGSLRWGQGCRCAYL